jgi:predicted CopG family antitoxin
MSKNNISNKMHTIAIDDNNYQTLRRLGSFGDSFNDVITGLITIAKRRAQEQEEDR